MVTYYAGRGVDGSRRVEGVGEKSSVGGRDEALSASGTNSRMYHEYTLYGG